VLERELSLAHAMADRAAEIALRWFRAADLEVRAKADRSPVTEADLAIERMVREEVARAFPGDRVVGEEGGGLEGWRRGRAWIVDPIDGTKNFADGVQLWSTLIALAVEGRVVLGVVSLPGIGERYEALRGRGARLNGRPISVSSTERLADAFVLFSSLEGWLTGPAAEGVLGLLRASRRSRGFGDAWSHMLVARGAADAMVERELALWDWAAIQVVVEEAGGRITQLDGRPLEHGGSAVSTNGRIHDQVLARLGPTGERAPADRAGASGGPGQPGRSVRSPRWPGPPSSGIRSPT
jgi:histidinol-phosphatase